MSNLVDLVVDNSPPVSGISIPLGAPISVTFNTLMDTSVSGLQSTLFIEGPDTDQFVGPGLLEQQYPHNVSQGDLNDFLRSPGYAGIVQGVITTSTVSGLTISGMHYVGTQAVFTPCHPLAPNTTYTVHVVETKDSLGNVCSGYIDWEFQTGTGSIQQLSNAISTSALAQAFRSPGLSPATVNSLDLISTKPADHSVQNNPTNTNEIDIVFDKPIDPTSVSADMISLQTVPMTDHPNITIDAEGELAFNYVVSGNILKILL